MTSEHQIDALLCEPFGNPQADAAGGTGYYRIFSLNDLPPLAIPIVWQEVRL